jgi:hypothetical protein
MADLAASRALLVRLKFSVPAAAAIVDEQGIDSLEEFKLLTDEDIESLCKVVRRPGGSVVNPDAHIAGQPGMIRDGGESISMLAEGNLKLCSFYLSHLHRVGRTTDYANVTLVKVRTMSQLKKYEKDHSDPTVEPTIDAKDWSRNLESLEEYLRGFLGVTKVPLSYVVRKEVEVTPQADDPPTNYETVADEMIARAPIEGTTVGTFDPAFQEDKRRVWELEAALLRNKECWTHMKPFQRTRDGRGAHLALFNNFLGPNMVDNMASKAERILETTSYSGEKRRWNFEKYVSMHKEQHSILTELMDQGYAGIDDRSKVRLLNQGIKTKELDVPKTQILSSAVLRSDFDGAVSLYKTFIEQMAPSNPTFQINETRTTYNRNDTNKWNRVKKSSDKKRSRDRDDDGGIDNDVEDRYYSSQEYSAMPKSKRRGLKAKRAKRDGNGANSGGKTQNATQSNAKMAALTSKLESMDRNISVLCAAASKVTFVDKSDNEEEEQKDSGNRNNQALVRKKR